MGTRKRLGINKLRRKSAIDFFLSRLKIVGMDEPKTPQSNRKRPNTVPHNAQSLRRLAEFVRDAAGALEAAAQNLELVADDKSVSVNHEKAVVQAIRSVRLMAADVQTKIVKGVFGAPVSRMGVVERATAILKTERLLAHEQKLEDERAGDERAING